MADQYADDSAVNGVVPTGIPGGFFVYNAQGAEEICYADPNIIALYGCRSMEEFRELTGNSFRGMVHPDDLEKVESEIRAQTFSSGKRHDYVRYRIITRQGKVRYVEDFGHLQRGGEGQSYYYVFIADVEQSEFFENSLNSFAEMQIFQSNRKVDRLTGFLNMRAFYDEIQDIKQEQAERAALSSIVVFDILGLREINRSLGREEGDARICTLADALRLHMPADCEIFRGHESELIVLCRNHDEQSMMSSIMTVVNACKSVILFGIGVFGSACDADFDCCGTAVQALEESYRDLRVKKMLNSGSARSQALNSLVCALEEVDADTEAHVRRTRSMGTALGRKIGLPDAQLTTLQLLCLLHDIGKIAVPLEILNKPGKLTNEEWAVIRSHAEKGYQIALASEELQPIASMIRYHHERWDGKGYPARLAGEAIPILSRIIAIVDAYDAMVNDRCYRKGMLPEAAKAEIRNNAGTQFDPHLAAAFLELLDENPSLSVGGKTGGGEVRVFAETAAQDGGTGLTSPVAFTRYELDLDERIVKVDDSFEAMTGYTREEAVGKLTQFDLIPPEEREYYLKQVGNQFAKQDIAYLRHPLMRKDGSVVQVICNGERYFDSSVKAFRSTILVFEVQ